MKHFLIAMAISLAAICAYALFVSVSYQAEDMDLWKASYEV